MVQRQGYGYIMEESVFGFRKRQGIFSFQLCGAGANITSNPLGIGDFSPQVTWPRLEAKYSLLFSSDVKTAWSCTSAQPYAFMVCYILQHKDKFTFTNFCSRERYFLQKIRQSSSFWKCSTTKYMKLKYEGTSLRFQEIHPCISTVQLTFQMRDDVTRF